MPIASGSGGLKYAYLDRDANVVIAHPPIQNNWYTVFDDDDVRLLWCVILQTNDEQAAKTVQIKWTIDGAVYYLSMSLTHNVLTYIYRNWYSSGGGIAGLSSSATEKNAAFYCDKRGQDFKVGVRITSALGTTQTLDCCCVKETLEQT